VSENRVLRRIFGPHRDEVTGEWRKLHNEEASHIVLNPKYHYADKIKKNEVDGACGIHGRGKRSVQDFGEEVRRKETTWNIGA
jgi:hypothetical protein